MEEYIDPDFRCVALYLKLKKKSRNKMILWINMNADVWRLVCVSPVEKEGLRYRAGY